MEDKGKEATDQQPKADLNNAVPQIIPNELDVQDLFEMCRSPLGFLKYAALFFFKNGNIDQAIICVKALLEDDKEIFNDVHSLTVKTIDDMRFLS